MYAPGATVIPWSPKKPREATSSGWRCTTIESVARPAPHSPVLLSVMRPWPSSLAVT
jgi:hypothetical protein